MKKYVILTLISISLILTVIATGYKRVNNIDYTSAIEVENTTALENLIYTGTIEYSNSYACTAKGTGMVQSVLVNDGDFVSNGDPIIVCYQTESEISKSDIMSAITSNNYDSLTSMFEKDASVIVYNAEADGIISGLDTEEGSVFQKGQSLFKISPEDSYQIQVNVTEKDIPKVEIGQAVKIDCKAVSKILSGTVHSIGSSAKQTTTTTGKETTIKVIIIINDECEEIKTGYTASCSINVEKKENTLLIPYNSLGTDKNNENFVYILSNGVLKQHYVVCGKEYNNGVEVINGLKEGDIILSEISEGEKLNNIVIDEVAVYEKQT